jgi:hypothetical protein
VKWYENSKYKPSPMTTVNTKPMTVRSAKRISVLMKLLDIECFQKLVQWYES